MPSSDLEVVLSIAVQLLFGVDHSSAAVNGEGMLGATFAPAVAAGNAVLQVGVGSDVIVRRHDAVDAERQVGHRQARHTHAVLDIEEPRTLVVHVRHRDNHSRRRRQRRQATVADRYLATVTMTT